MIKKNNANRQAMAMAVAEHAKELGFAITPEGASNDDITQRVYCLILESSPAFWIGMMLTKHDLTVIKKLNVTVHEGEILAIAGASGSGKASSHTQFLGYFRQMLLWAVRYAAAASGSRTVCEKKKSVRRSL